ncbi:MAG: hypothetical protein ACREF5_01960 [Candidatus Saccharimonadales bacterium]
MLPTHPSYVIVIFCKVIWKISMEIEDRKIIELFPPKCLSAVIDAAQHSSRQEEMILANSTYIVESQRQVDGLTRKILACQLCSVVVSMVNNPDLNKVEIQPPEPSPNLCPNVIVQSHSKSFEKESRKYLHWLTW